MIIRRFFAAAPAAVCLLVSACGGGGIRLAADRDLTLVYDRTGGHLKSVEICGVSYPLDSGETISGFVLHDAETGRTEEAAGVLSKAAEGWTFIGRSDSLRLELTATIVPESGRLKFHCEAADLAGRDRAVTAGFHLPIDLTGGRFWWEPRSFLKIESGESYHRTLPGERGASRWWMPEQTDSFLGYPTGGVTAYLRCNLYPLQALETARGGELIAVATPVEEPRISRTEYDSDGGGLRISVDFGLSPETKKFPSRASFDFDLFGARVPGTAEAAEKGAFRAALKRYYDIYPHAFVKRLTKAGIHLPFERILNIERPLDFGFYFHEGTSSTAADDSLDVLTFRYIEPMSNWQRMPPAVPRTYEASIKFLRGMLNDDRRGRLSRATLSCGTYEEDGRLRMWIRNEPWCDGALFLLNPDPELPETDESPGNRAHVGYRPDDADRRYADTSNGVLDGEYFDSVEGWYNYINYRREHFPYVDFPLVFNPESKRLGIYQAFSNLEFIRYVVDDVRRRGKYAMANWTPYGLNHICCELDAVVSEIGYRDKSRWTPEEDNIQMLRRTMVYQKPYCVLANTNFDTFTHDRVELYMRQSLFYGFFPSMFSMNAATDRYFQNPELYNRDRDLFRKYIPLLRALDAAGWEPVTFAATGDDSVYVERFGRAGGGEMYLTVLNVSAGTKNVRLAIDGAALGWASPADGVKEMVTRTILPLEADGSIRMRLMPWEVAMIRLRADAVRS